MDRLIDDLNGLNREAQQLFDEIKDMSTEEEKLDNINDEDMQYDRQDKHLWRTRRENSGTGVKRLQSSMEVKS